MTRDQEIAALRATAAEARDEMRALVEAVVEAAVTRRECRRNVHALRVQLHDAINAHDKAVAAFEGASRELDDAIRDGVSG